MAKQIYRLHIAHISAFLTQPSAGICIPPRIGWWQTQCDEDGDTYPAQPVSVRPSRSLHITEQRGSRQCKSDAGVAPPPCEPAAE